MKQEIERMPDETFMSFITHIDDTVVDDWSFIGYDSWQWKHWFALPLKRCRLPCDGHPTTGAGRVYCPERRTLGPRKPRTQRKRAGVAPVARQQAMAAAIVGGGILQGIGSGLGGYAQYVLEMKKLENQQILQNNSLSTREKIAKLESNTKLMETYVKYYYATQQAAQDRATATLQTDQVAHHPVQLPPALEAAQDSLMADLGVPMDAPPRDAAFEPEPASIPLAAPKSDNLHTAEEINALSQSVVPTPLNSGLPDLTTGVTRPPLPEGSASVGDSSSAPAVPVAPSTLNPEAASFVPSSAPPTAMPSWAEMAAAQEQAEQAASAPVVAAPTQARQVPEVTVTPPTPVLERASAPAALPEPAERGLPKPDYENFAGEVPATLPRTPGVPPTAAPRDPTQKPFATWLDPPPRVERERSPFGDWIPDKEPIPEENEDLLESFLKNASEFHFLGGSHLEDSSVPDFDLEDFIDGYSRDEDNLPLVLSMAGNRHAS
jgi:hypothetical protein